MTIHDYNFQIVFCPSAAISDVEESLWSIHGRCAAVANNFYTCNINRVGLEEHINQFTAGDGRPPQKHFGQFFGSCYVAAPDGTRTPGLCRNRDGLLITELDLNLCRQAKDIWGLRVKIICIFVSNLRWNDYSLLKI